MHCSWTSEINFACIIDIRFDRSQTELIRRWFFQHRANCPSQWHPRKNGLTPIEIKSKKPPCSTPWLFKLVSKLAFYKKSISGNKIMDQRHQWMMKLSFILLSCNLQIKNQYRACHCKKQRERRGKKSLSVAEVWSLEKFCWRHHWAVLQITLYQVSHHSLVLVRTPPLTLPPSSANICTRLYEKFGLRRHRFKESFNGQRKKI